MFPETVKASTSNEKLLVSNQNKLRTLYHLCLRIGMPIAQIIQSNQQFFLLCTIGECDKPFNDDLSILIAYVSSYDTEFDANNTATNDFKFKCMQGFNQVKHEFLCTRIHYDTDAGLDDKYKVANTSENLNPSYNATFIEKIRYFIDKMPNDGTSNRCTNEKYLVYNTKCKTERIC